jgi:hypothetical protein
LSNRIYQIFSLSLTITDIFNHLTIRIMAAYIDSCQHTVHEKIECVSPSPYYPVSSAQKRLYVLHKMDESSTIYNIPAVMEITGSIDRLKFENAVRALVMRHEILRTSIEMAGEEPVQVIHDSIDFKISYSMNDGIDFRQAIEEFIKPFELEKPPLFRIKFMSLSPDRHIFVFDMHHIISDGRTMEILLEDFRS